MISSEGECLVHRPLLPPAFGDVPEDEHDPGEVPPLVADRGGALVDGSFGAVPGGEQGVLRHADDAIPQGQRSLKCCPSKDFQQEVFVPATTAAFHGDTVAAGMLLQ